MFKIKVILVVIVTDIKNRQNTSVLTNFKEGVITLPAKYLGEGDTSRVVAADMLEEYTGVSSNWAILTPLGVFDGHNKKDEEGTRIVDIAFSVYIPEQTRQRQPHLRWVSFNELNRLKEVGEFSEENFEIITSAIWRPI